MKAFLLLFAITGLVSAFRAPPSYDPTQIQAGDALNTNFDYPFDFNEPFHLLRRDELDSQLDGLLYRRNRPKGKVFDHIVTHHVDWPGPYRDTPPPVPPKIPPPVPPKDTPPVPPKDPPRPPPKDLRRPPPQHGLDTVPDSQNESCSSRKLKIKEGVNYICQAFKDPETRAKAIDGACQATAGACAMIVGLASAAVNPAMCGVLTVGGFAVVCRGVGDVLESARKADDNRKKEEAKAEAEAASGSSAPSVAATATTRASRRAGRKRALELAYLNYALFLEDI